MDQAPGASLAAQRSGPTAAAGPFLPFQAQIALCLIVTAGVFFLAGRWSHGWTTAPLVSEADPDPALDLNRATKAELTLIPGIGEGLAQRIIDHRSQRGPFRSVDELRQVFGIGPKTLQRVRPRLFVAPQESFVSVDDGESMPAVMMPARSAAPSKKELALTGSINVNRADQSELQKLPGIGPKLSQRILDERAKVPFKSPDELRRVPGIGVKTLEKLRPYVTIE